MNILLVVAVVLVVPMLIALFALQLGASQFGDSEVTGTIQRPDLLSMGPDPGGHTGATVTPQTTRTDQPAVDSAREASSGANTESSAVPRASAPQPNKKNGRFDGLNQISPSARGYFVSTVGRDEAMIREYMRNQEKVDEKLEQIKLWQ